MDPTAALERLTQISGQISGQKSARDKILEKNPDDVCPLSTPLSNDNPTLC